MELSDSVSSFERTYEIGEAMPVLPLRSMRRAGRFCAFLTCVSLVVLHTDTAASDPAEPVETPSGDVQPAVQDGAAGPDSLQAQVHALPADIEVRRHVVSGDGTVIGQPATVGESTLIYSNTLGREVFGSHSAGLQFADDITTVGGAGCSLDRYEFLVSGDRDGDGSGEGPFGVDFALYDGCPGGGASVIAGTEGYAGLPDEGYHLIVFQVPTEVEVPLPNRFWLQLALSREHAGVVVGAPAQLGYSMDRFYYPGFSCTANLGEFPLTPHASFHIEVYARGPCANSFVGYQNTNGAGNGWSAGEQIYFADDIELAVRECRMVAYETVYEGRGFAGRVDLRRYLDDADEAEGGLIEGTRMGCSPSAGVCRREFDPPIPIPQNLWAVFVTMHGEMGPIVTCREAQPGQSERGYMVYRDDEWESEGFSTCDSEFSLVIYCEGLPPTGACCDTIFTDEEGQAVCREVAEMNCPFNRWLEDEACEPDPFDPACGLFACCTPDDTCENLTEDECSALAGSDEQILWRRGVFCENFEDTCPFYACMQRKGDCSIARPETGCEDPFCCQDVCEFDPWCCQVAWDELCLRWAQESCERGPDNDSCNWPLEVDSNSTTVISTVYADVSAADAYCCHKDEPGSAATGSVWFMFEATHTSARIHTCNTSDQGKDSLIMVYRDLDSQLTPWSVCDIDGRDGIACSDDAPGCGDGQLSDVCVTDLIPGETYHVALAGKTEDDLGIYHLDIESPCTPAVEGPPNDYCHHAETITESVTPFDLAGATLDCPGPPPSPVCTNTMKVDLWYDWVAPCYGKITVQTCGFDEFGNPSDDLTPDTSLVVYDGCECPVGMPMEQSEGVFACSDFMWTPCFLGSKLSDLQVEAGECYKIRIGGDPRLGEPAGNLTITTDCPTFCPAGALTFVDPPDGVVDARQPHPIGTPTALQGIDSIIVAAPDGAIATCFTLCETSGSETLHPPYEPGFESNEITGVEANGDGTYTVTLKRPITPGEVTTVTYRDNNGTTTTGSFTAHPANVNADSYAVPADILEIIEIINGVQTPLWGAYSSDIDHSSVTGPPDILRVIDLLNAGWLNTPLPTNAGTCP